MPDHAHWMRRALHLAASRAGATWPNPTVGAVVVQDGQLLAEGAHEAAGRDHGEVAALRGLADGAARGATLYVTLEPCHHHGRTPPCTAAIHRAGISRVVYAIDDPNPRVPGGGAAWLREQGIDVHGGLLSGPAHELNHPWLETEGGQHPHVTLKLALSLDGRLARRRGRVEDPAERRITGERAHRRAHQLRVRAGCVVVGRETVAADRPRLDVRHVASPRGPRPVVLDARLALDPAWLPAGSLVATGPEPDPARVRTLEQRGHEVWSGPLREGRVAWGALLDHLHGRGLGGVLVEGGATVAASLLAEDRVHRLHLLLAPVLLGGDGPRFDPRPDLESRWRTVRSHRLGSDVEWVLARAR